MFKKVLIILVINLCTCYGFFYNETPVIEVLKRNDLYFKKYYNPFLNETINFLREFSENNEINQACRSSLKRWVNGIQNNEVWSLKFLEATGKTISGKLIGGNINYGFFDYCVDFRRNEKKNIDFDGKYCLISIHTPETEITKKLDSFKYSRNALTDRVKKMVDWTIGEAHGICMPHTCDVEELISVFNKSFKSYGFSAVPSQKCSTISQPEPFTTLQMVTSAILSIFIVLCILSCFTKNEFLSKNFSLINNFKIIYNFDPNNNINEQSAFLHGTKFFMIILSITFHVVIVNLFLYPQAWSMVKEIKVARIIKLHFTKFLIVADGLFFVGGFFAMYAWYDALKSGQIKYNFKNFFLLRYVKVGIIATIVILITFIFPHFGNGPMYSHFANHFSYNCKFNFWHIFSLTSNEQYPTDHCIIPAWYLSADFQVYILNYFVIYYLIKKPKLGFTLAFIQLFIFSVLNLIYFYFNELPANFSSFDYTFYEFFTLGNKMYFHSFLHYNTYTLGLICAWLVKNEIKFNFLNFKPILYLVNLSSILIPMIFFFYLDDVKESGIKLNSYFEFFLPIIDKFVVNFSTFWFFYSGSLNYNVWLRNMFSFKAFVPWSRLAFSLILCQFFYVFYWAGSIRQIVLFDPFHFLKEAIVAYLATFIIGNIIFCFFEAPLTNLCLSYFGIQKRSKIMLTKDENGDSECKKD